MQTIANGLAGMANNIAIVSFSSGSTKLLLEEALFHINSSMHTISQELGELGFESYFTDRNYVSMPEAETEEDLHIRNVSDM